MDTSKAAIDNVYQSHQTADVLPLKERLGLLKQLQQTVLLQQEAIAQALHQDLRKHPTEVLITEIFPLINELKHTRRHLKSWVKPKPVANDLLNFGAKTSLYYEPKGSCLIISPWNYPFQLPLLHLVSSVAAGNRTIIKPSEFTPHTNRILKALVQAVFPKEWVAVIEGDVETTTYLLTKKFDHIHFTGSPAVGKIIMAAAARHLASCTLELGGKSPAIIDDKISVDEAAQKLVFGKFINLGQTCIAPDYVLVPAGRKEAFVTAMVAAIGKAFGADIRANDNLSRIINAKNYHRLMGYIQSAQAAGATLHCGGNGVAEDLYVAPTVISDLPTDHPLLEEEIFGPILPIVTYNGVAEASAFITQRPKPLAMYLFTHQSKWEAYFKQKTSSGALVVNETMIHMTHPNLPFGGVNHSGIGQSTGYFGFKDFTHEKPVLVANRLMSMSTLVGFPYRNRISRFLEWWIK